MILDKVSGIVLGVVSGVFSGTQNFGHAFLTSGKEVSGKHFRFRARIFDFGHTFLTSGKRFGPAHFGPARTS